MQHNRCSLTKTKPQKQRFPGRCDQGLRNAIYYTTYSKLKEGFPCSAWLPIIVLWVQIFTLCNRAFVLNSCFSHPSSHCYVSFLSIANRYLRKIVCFFICFRRTTSQNFSIGTASILSVLGISWYGTRIQIFGSETSLIVCSMFQQTRPVQNSLNPSSWPTDHIVTTKQS